MDSARLSMLHKSIENGRGVAAASMCESTIEIGHMVNWVELAEGHRLFVHHCAQRESVREYRPKLVKILGMHSPDSDLILSLPLATKVTDRVTIDFN